MIWNDDQDIISSEEEIPCWDC